MEELKDAKPEEQVVPPVDPSATEGKSEDTSTAEVEKTEKVSDDKQAKEDKPWHKDPRFQEDLRKHKELEERVKAFDDIQADPDFATFIAFKRNKEALAEAEKKVDFSKMTAEEYADYVAGQSEKRAEQRFESLVEENKKGDDLSREAVSFAEKVGVTKEVFQKEYAPKILEYYENVAKKVKDIDAFVEANPPREVFKTIHFDRASEAGVTEYKQKVDKAKAAVFEGEGGAGKTGKLDAKSEFEKNWAKLYGNTTELPEAAFERNR